MAHKHLRILALLLTVFAFGSVLLAGCARPGTAGTGSTSNVSNTPAAPACASGDTVKTGSVTFEQSCIALKKGGTLKIVQDVTSYHILDFGQWNNGAAQPASPAGAPPLKDLKLSGASVNIGPFTTAGTFHIYCIIHPGMDLTVMVQ